MMIVAMTTAVMRIIAMRIVATITVVTMTGEVAMMTHIAIARTTDTRSHATTIVLATTTSGITGTDIPHRSTWAATTLPTTRAMTRTLRRPTLPSPAIPTRRPRPSQRTVNRKRTMILPTIRQVAIGLFVKKQSSRSLPAIRTVVSAGCIANSAGIGLQAT